MGKSKNKRQKVEEEQQEVQEPEQTETKAEVKTEVKAVEEGDAKPEHVKKLKNKKKLKKQAEKANKRDKKDKQKDEEQNEEVQEQKKEKVKETKPADATEVTEQDGEKKDEQDLSTLPGNENLTAFQLADRKKRIVFVGNIPIEFKAKQLWRVFKSCGKIEKIWFRSIAPESFITNRTNIAKGKMYGQQKNNKNAYILFESEDCINKALEYNNYLIQEDPPFHIRVDSDSNKENDFKTTIFVGNLPYIVNEEEIREHFETIGKIVNIRVVRDNATLIGKGIAFIQFENKEDALKAVKLGIKSYKIKTFKGREIRIKKAVSVDRRQRKQERLQEKFSKRDNQQNKSKDGTEEVGDEDIARFVGKKKPESKPEFHNDIKLKKHRKRKMLQEMMDHGGKSRVRDKSRKLINKKNDHRKRYNDRREKRREMNTRNLKKVMKGNNPSKDKSKK